MKQEPSFTRYRAALLTFLGFAIIASGVSAIVLKSEDNPWAATLAALTALFAALTFIDVWKWGSR